MESFWNNHEIINTTKIIAQWSVAVFSIIALVFTMRSTTLVNIKQAEIRNADSLEQANLKQQLSEEVKKNKISYYHFYTTPHETSYFLKNLIGKKINVLMFGQIMLLTDQYIFIDSTGQLIFTDEVIPMVIAKEDILVTITYQ